MSDAARRAAEVIRQENDGRSESIIALALRLPKNPLDI